MHERVAAACDRGGRDAAAVRVIAVTKTHPVEVVQACIDAGIRDIGENRVQELEQKAPELHGDRELHLVGHLQTNKVAKALPLVQWIHSLDSLRLLEAIERRAAGRRVKALVEVNTSGEASKSGCSPGECRALCEAVSRSSAVEFRGLMTVGPLTGGEAAARGSFRRLRELGESCADLAPVIELSMGMSGDFEWAVEEGATMVRIGTLLLG